MSELTAAMDALAQKFLARCGTDLAKLKEFLADSTDRQSEVRHIVHRMSGSAGIFGHVALGELASQIDGELAAGRPVRATTLSALIEALSSLLADPRDKQT